MHILVADLDEDAAGFGKKIAGDEEAVAEIGEVGVDAEFPRVAEGGDLLSLGGEVGVFAVFDRALIDEGLEVGAVLDAVGRVEVDHLDFAGEGLFFDEGVHHDEGVACDKAVGPVAWVCVELDGLAEGRVFGVGLEEGGLGGLAVAVASADGLDDGSGVEALVLVEGDGVDVEVS